ncbi:uncharacterized protein LOC106764438 [Vigna radiata var. radiata]|uniref:Uncharacterized protein LOC106764438 n=1 Tax=Vigna radiata var. radiata TaxID=3916 RepID=A0A1S3UE34_VIGRR|nr:uncharacterized protein LOC106764438 [Vigna radiata var. radiata]
MSQPYVYESRRPVRIIPTLPGKTIVVSGIQNKTIADSFTMQKIMEALHNADRDKNGSYNKDELKQALRDLGAYFPGWRAFRAFGKADANNDGQISGEEIDTLIEYLHSCGFGK